jgi:hypothetical protein
MPVYRCRYLDRAGNPVKPRVASESEAEAVAMARNMSAISGAGGFELWQGERCLHTEEADATNAGRADGETDLPARP